MSGYLEHALHQLDQALQAANDQPEDQVRKHTLIMFGVAALTLDAARAETAKVPEKLDSEVEQAIGLVYAIRCAPAHDISEPLWKLWPKYRRLYDVAGLHVDLTDRDGKPFEMDHVGGPGTLRILAEYLRARGMIKQPA